MTKDGLLIVNKPGGMTSHDVVDRFRSLLGERRIGHTGTLDPDATGVLVLAVGRATRIIPFLPLNEKEYRAGISLGVSTDTHDASGRPIGPDRRGDLPDRRRLAAALGRFQGVIEQVPPMVSALKHQGKRLYQLARDGREVPRPPRHVNIKEIELLDYRPPRLDIRLVCSAGTYVRSLAHDLGRLLDTGAHLAELVRLRVGPYDLDRALGPQDWPKLQQPAFRERTFVSLERALAHLPAWTAPESAARSLGDGRPVPAPAGDGPPWEGDPLVAVSSDAHGLIAVARRVAREGGMAYLEPVRVLHRPDPVECRTA